MPLQRYALYQKQKYKVVAITGGRNGIPPTAHLEALDGDTLTVLESELGKSSYVETVGLPCSLTNVGGARNNRKKIRQWIKEGTII